MVTTTDIPTTSIEPGTPTWRRLMTASKVAAILGVSQYDSPRSMWHKMRNELPAEEQTDVQSRGHYLEPAILAWWADRHGVDRTNRSAWINHPAFYMDGWAAATPDAQATLDGDLVLVEAKSARDMDEWGAPGTDEIPTKYLFQAYWQMHVSGVHTCYIPVIGAFLDFEEYVVVYDREIGATLERRCLEFYESLKANEPPELDDSGATYDALRKLYRTIDDSSIEIPFDDAREYLDAKADLKAAEARERKAKSTVLDLMGEHRFATCAGVKVARRQANKTGFQLNQVAKSSADLTTTPSTAEGTAS